MSSSSFRLGAVHFACTFALSVLDVMVTYLTDVWNLNLTHAAAIINVFVGGRDMLLLVMLFIVDTCLGYHVLLPISITVNCIVCAKLPTPRISLYVSLDISCLGTAIEVAILQSFQ